MSSGGGAVAAAGDESGRVSIPNNVWKMIQNIKEITGNHSEEDIYAMLKECSMDPNETADKLLLQDTFHEVKRKRDKRKENLNKEPAESRWKPGMQGRGSKGGRGSSSSRNNSHDGGVGRNLALRKENGPSQVLEKGVSVSSSVTIQDTRSKEAISAASTSTANSNGANVVASGNIAIKDDSKSSMGSAAGMSEGLQAPADSKKNPVITCGPKDQSRKKVSSSSNSTTVQSPGPYFSASHPVPSPLQDSQHPNAVGTIWHEVGSQRTYTEQAPSHFDKSKLTSAAASDPGSSIVQGKLPSKVHVVGKNHYLVESSQNATSVHASSSVSRPSSNYNNRSQVIGPQKVGPNMEWKPKPMNPILAQGSGAAASSKASAVAIEANANLQPKSNSLDSKEVSVELQKKLEDLHMSDGQYVIIPNHLHVPAADKLGFCFGSFDASFGIDTSHNSTPESFQSALSESTDGNEEAAAEEQFSSNQNEFATEEVDYPENNQSTSYNAENLSSNEGGVSSTAVAESSEPKQENTPESNLYSVTHTSTNYNFGFMQPVVGNQLSPFESSEAQVRDVPRLPTIMVQQPFDPTGYYAHVARPGADTDGRISPFHSAGVAAKYNGNLAVVSPQTSQSAQEGTPLVLSTAAPTPLVNHTGVLQNSMAVTQQTLSVFRPPTGLHLPHYPTSYIPYGHYFPPFYVPPPAVHQFLGNGAFPQQPQGGSVYPTPSAAAAKFSLPQYKPGTHTNNSNHVGVPGTYGPYGSSMTMAAGNSTSNEDLAASHFKETNAYAGGQQSEGSGVWIAPSGRDMSGLQASSFYNLPQGQMAFTPAQPSHGTFANVYHPSQQVSATAVHPLLQQSQAMAGPVDMVGPTGSVYQQPQHSQMNWPNNF